MLGIVIFFLLVSVYLYVLLGGADFGAGIIEFFSSKENKEKNIKLINRAMAPIWEANHMWLIIAVVILFNAFPKIYIQVSISMYIPLILMLIGIVLRGTAFTFRHYDAYKDKAQHYYNLIFTYSSLIVPMFFGMIIGGIVSGKIPSAGEMDFFSSYIYPWLNLFSISVGLFTVSIFAFIASVYLIGDTTAEEDRVRFIAKSKFCSLLMILAGGLVFLTSILSGTDFTQRFFSNWISISLIILATLILPVTWKIISLGKIWLSRVFAGAHIFFVLSAFYKLFFPEIIRFSNKTSLSLIDSSAGDIPVKYLAIALLAGSCIIFPILFYLLRIFKGEKEHIAD